MAADDRGALMVVEALLAGMIILTAVLFLTNVSKPSPPAAESGIDLEGVARDVLIVMANRPPTDTDERCPDAPPAVDCYSSRLEEIASDALGLGEGSFGVTTPAERDSANAVAKSFIDQVIPVGNRWLLRLDNGVEPLVLLPASGTNVQLTPRAAKAAETFIVPPWQENAGALADGGCGAPPAAVFTPGADESTQYLAAGGTQAAPTPFTVTAASTLVSPTGDLPPQGYTSWADWWTKQQAAQVAAGVTDGGVRIPPNALYGWWRLDADGAGPGPAACLFIGLPGGTATDYPVYGVQLVVWPIAG